MGAPTITKLISFNKTLIIFYYTTVNMEEEKNIRKETLKPITRVKSKEDKELQELEVESTGGGTGGGGG
ncbi:MAG TPA: hypothetical protein VIW25_04695 [Nitrososphaeraceae archaeon]|jgi:hypothetical protein